MAASGGIWVKATPGHPDFKKAFISAKTITAAADKYGVDFGYMKGFATNAMKTGKHSAMVAELYSTAESQQQLKAAKAYAAQVKAAITAPAPALAKPVYVVQKNYETGGYMVVNKATGETVKSVQSQTYAKQIAKKMMGVPYMVSVKKKAGDIVAQTQSHYIQKVKGGYEVTDEGGNVILVPTKAAGLALAKAKEAGDAVAITKVKGGYQLVSTTDGSAGSVAPTLSEAKSAAKMANTYAQLKPAATPAPAAGPTSPTPGLYTGNVVNAKAVAAAQGIPKIVATPSGKYVVVYPDGHVGQAFSSQQFAQAVAKQYMEENPPPGAKPGQAPAAKPAAAPAISPPGAIAKATGMGYWVTLPGGTQQLYGTKAAALTASQKIMEGALGTVAPAQAPPAAKPTAAPTLAAAIKGALTAEQLAQMFPGPKPKAGAVATTAAVQAAAKAKVAMDTAVPIPATGSATLTTSVGQSVQVKGTQYGQLLVHPAINQPGKWEVTHLGSGQHLAHAVDENTAKSIAKTLHSDPVLGEVVKKSTISSAEQSTLNSVASTVKHHTYTQGSHQVSASGGILVTPEDSPAPAWGTKHQAWTNNSAGDDFLAQNWPQKPATSGQASAMGHWQGSGYGSINSPLWKGQAPTGDHKTTVDALDGIIGAQSTPFPMVVARAEYKSHALYAQAAKLHVGDPYVNLGFDATMSGNQSSWSDGGVRIQYRLPAGFQAVHLNSLPGFQSGLHSEHEVLLSRNNVWQVKGRTVGSGGEIELVVEWVGKVTTPVAQKLHAQYNED